MQVNTKTHTDISVTDNSTDVTAYAPDPQIRQNYDAFVKYIRDLELKMRGYDTNEDTGPKPIASYRTAGKTNEDTDRDVLKDLTGNGHNIVLKNFGFTLGSGYEDGALVFDGVDDYGICEDFPALKDFTIIYKRINLNPSKTNQAFISNRSTEITKRLIIEHTHPNANVTIVGNSSKNIASVYDPSKKPVYVLPTSYNGQISLGNPTFDPIIGLILGTYPSESSVYCWNGAFYALDIYDKTLEGDELQTALNNIEK